MDGYIDGRMGGKTTCACRWICAGGTKDKLTFRKNDGQKALKNKYKPVGSLLWWWKMKSRVTATKNQTRNRPGCHFCLPAMIQIIFIIIEFKYFHS